jgi:hypothetical protein
LIANPAGDLNRRCPVLLFLRESEVATGMALARFDAPNNRVACLTFMSPCHNGGRWHVMGTISQLFLKQQSGPPGAPRKSGLDQHFVFSVTRNTSNDVA